MKKFILDSTFSDGTPKFEHIFLLQSQTKIPKIQVTFQDGHQDIMVLEEHFASVEIKKLDENTDEKFCHFIGKF